MSSKGSASSGLQIEHVSERNSANPRASTSTNSIISTGEQRLHEEFGHKFHQPASVILYGVVGVAAFVAIAAGITSYLGRYTASSLLYDITDSGGDVVGSHAGPRVLSPTFKKGTSVSPKKQCRNPWCSEQMAALIRSLDASVRPCQDFYGHVCTQPRVRNGKAAKQLAQPTEARVMSFLQGIGKVGREAHVVRASARLWQDCVDVPNLRRLGNVPLEDLLKLTGLGGWPYRIDDALPDVWVAAGKLQRLMELAPLVEVNVRADNTLRLSHGYRNGSVGADDVLTAMLTMHQNRPWLRPLSEDVAALSNKMDGLLQSHEPLVPHHQLSDADSVLRPFLQVALEGVRPDARIVRTELDNFIDPLVQLVGETRPETVLNLLGYRLVRHVDVFIPTAVKADIKSGALYRRRSRCSRVVLEDALTADAAEYVRYAALRSQLDFDGILFVEKHLKRVLHAKLAGLPWMDHQTRQRAQQRLRDMKVRFSDDRYEGSHGRTPVRLPEALPSQALATYQRFRAARFRSRMLRVYVVQENRTDPDCTHDGSNNVLHLRLSSALEGRDPRNQLWPVLQAARLAPILSRCMLRVLLLPETPTDHRAQHRGKRVAPSVGFKRFLACLRAQHPHGTSASTGSGRRMFGAIHSAALEPARTAYDEYVVRLARKTPLEQLMGRRDPRALQEWNQTFYVAYARSMCETPHRHEPNEPQVPPRELVNGPLSNDRGFHRAFHCLRGEQMRPEPTCRFWDDSPNDI
ncbi:neprilysin-1-like [Haemaphysalis longicornis]